LEQEYDKVLDNIIHGIEDNYGNDEINHVLDLIALRRGNETEFQHVVRMKNEILE
jgi:hypothetical protein